MSVDKMLVNSMKLFVNDNGIAAFLIPHKCKFNDFVEWLNWLNDAGQGSYYQDCEKLCGFYAKFCSIINLCQNKDLQWILLWYTLCVTVNGCWSRRQIGGPVHPCLLSQSARPPAPRQYFPSLSVLIPASTSFRLAKSLSKGRVKFSPFSPYF